ncbi:type II toxin-antitoxin system MqsA family antitoxin [Terasakiella pusilla]|uniref:type II toxin-antitoxin system MqsA family antitoxin n=1 Tax=Terasakiella pusilla TaxID=64973 RepID=UPI003AA82A76
MNDMNVEIHADACPCCDGKTQIHWVEREFDWKMGNQSFQVKSRIPVEYCQECDLEFEGEEAEIRKHDAICRTIGRLTPGDIESIQKKSNMSHKQFAELAGVGTASLSRWKNRKTIQDESIDRLLRLISQPGGVLRTQIAKSEADTSCGKILTFRGLQGTEDQLRKKSRNFSL